MKKMTFSIVNGQLSFCTPYILTCTTVPFVFFTNLSFLKVTIMSYIHISGTEQGKK